MVETKMADDQWIHMIGPNARSIPSLTLKFFGEETPIIRWYLSGFLKLFLCGCLYVCVCVCVCVFVCVCVCVCVRPRGY